MWTDFNTCAGMDLYTLRIIPFKFVATVEEYLVLFKGSKVSVLMYKQFKKGATTASDVTNTVVTRSLSNLSVNDIQADTAKDAAAAKTDTHGDAGEAVDPVVQQAVQRCWETIQTQCAQEQSPVRKSKPTGGGTEWRTVRVFVSSTFTDFYCERDILVKKVFPELREWCRARRLYLIECDMRWGVPKDSTTNSTISACLEEIDKAIKETDGQPFFLNMVGEKYGWIPPFDSLTDSLKEKYKWVPDTSITFMEVMHGAYRTQNPNAVFMIRDTEVMKQIPDKLLPRYTDTNALGAHQLKMFKKMLPSRFPNQVFPYICKVDGVITRYEKEYANMVELDQFSDRVLDFFKSTITNCYPDRQPGQEQSILLSLDEETASQKLVIEQCAASLVGRQREAQLMWSFVQGKLDRFTLRDSTSKPFVRVPNFWGEELCSGNAPLCLCAPQGQGKTTLMAWLTMKALQSDREVFYHFCGSTGSSYSVFMLLRRLIAFLSQDYNKENLEALQKMNEEELRNRTKLELVNMQKDNSQRKIIIILDAMNQLSTGDTSVRHLFWLAPSFPRNIQCVISTAKHPSTESRLFEHPHYLLTLEPLSGSDAREITLTMLNKFGKKLDNEQLDLVLASDCSSNPLWLYLVCEELRVYGDFRSLTAHMANVTASIQDMLQAILNRLIADDDTGYMEQTLCILACNHGVLTTQDVQRMLGNVKTREALPALTWARIRRSLQTFLCIANYNDQIVFIHNLVKQAVKEKSVKNRAQAAPWHTKIADYLEHWCEDSAKKRDDLPYHLQQAGLKDRIVNFIWKIPESSYMPDFMRSRYMDECRCPSLADPVFGPTVSPVMICGSCSMSNAVYYPRPFHRNKDMCVVCGSRVAFTPVSNNAYLCSFHSPFAGAGIPMCFLCGRGAPKMMSAPGRLCTHCGFGNSGKKCAKVFSS